MYAGKHILAIIPARGGSKRLPRKNVLSLGGHPLIAWSIRAAKQCPLIDEVVVSTDDAEIAHIAAQYGAKVHHRPEALSQDDTPSLPVFVDCLGQFPNADLVLALQPTSPFRRQEDLSQAIKQMISEHADALMAVSKMKLGPEWALRLVDGALEMPSEEALSRVRTQDQQPRFQPNGNLYAYTRETLMKAERYAFGKKTLPLIIPSPYDIDIDDAVDFKLAEVIAHEFDFHWT